MSWSTYVNLEIIVLEIIERELVSLHESNIESEDGGVVEYDIDRLLDGYKSGYIIVTMLVSLIESFLNDILNQYFPENNERLLRQNIDEKLDLIYLFNNKNPNTLRGSHFYEQFKSVKQIRNELIHYKSSYIGDHSYIESISIGKYDLGELFIKQELSDYTVSTKGLINKIASDLDIELNYDVKPITSDGYNDNYRFATMNREDD